MKRQPIITSAKQANEIASKLKTVWSSESYLSLRVLIHCAALLEQIAGKPKRKKSKWNAFLSKQLKAGKTVREAASAYRKT